jgi:hypothetical protein
VEERNLLPLSARLLEGPNILKKKRKNTMTGDETWAFRYDPEAKPQIFQWKILVSDPK